MTTRFRQFYFSMDREARRIYAERAGTTHQYMKCMLVGVPPRRQPKVKLLHGLVSASNGALSMDDMFEHFFRADKADAA